MSPNRAFVAPAALVFLHLALYLTLQVRPGVTGVLLWYVGPLALAGLALLLMAGMLVSALRHRATWNLTDLARLLVLVGLAASPGLYQTYPSSHDGRPSAVRFVLPLTARASGARDGS